MRGDTITAGRGGVECLDDDAVEEGVATTTSRRREPGLAGSM